MRYGFNQKFFFICCIVTSISFAQVRNPQVRNPVSPPEGFMFNKEDASLRLDNFEYEDVYINEIDLRNDGSAAVKISIQDRRSPYPSGGGVRVTRHLISYSKVFISSEASSAIIVLLIKAKTLDLPLKMDIDNGYIQRVGM
ncbi:hypothetical protein MRY82_02480 [bacterium]|nr:hypothetical protein [bacterium]